MKSMPSVFVEGHSGRDWLIADDKLLFRPETFFAGDRLYQILLVTPLGVAFKDGRASAKASDLTDLYESNAGRFFGSFKLLPPDASGPRRAVGP